MNKKALLASYIVEVVAMSMFVFFIIIFFFFVAKQAGEPVSAQAVQNRDAIDQLLITLGALSGSFDEKMTVADKVIITHTTPVFGRSEVSEKLSAIVRVFREGIPQQCSVSHRVRTESEAERPTSPFLHETEEGGFPTVSIPLPPNMRRRDIMTGRVLEKSLFFNIEVDCP